MPAPAPPQPQRELDFHGSSVFSAPARTDSPLPHPFREILQELRIGFRDWKHGCVDKHEAARERPAALPGLRPPHGSPAGPGSRLPSELAGCPPSPSLCLSSLLWSPRCCCANYSQPGELISGKALGSLPFLGSQVWRAAQGPLTLLLSEVLHSPGLGVHAPSSRGVVLVRLIFSMPQLPSKEQKGLRGEHGGFGQREARTRDMERRQARGAQATGRWHTRVKAARAKGALEPVLG